MKNAAKATQFRRMAAVRNDQGLIIPTVSDLVYMAITSPGYGDSQGLNICLWSDPGSGKTSLVKEAIKAAGYEPYVIVLTRVAPEDMTGIPRVIEVKIDADGNPLAANATDAERQAARSSFFTVKTPDIGFIEIASNKKAAIIFDDATNSTPAVQAAALDIFLEKEFADGNGKRVTLKHAPQVVMANYGEGSALTPFLAPVANRMAHVVMTARDVVLWWRSKRASQLTIDLDKATTINSAAYEKLLDKYWAMVEDYIGEKGESALSDPTPQDFPNPADYAFATSRSYEFMVRWMASCEYYGVDDSRILPGCIGKEKAAEFTKWRTLIRLVRDAHAGKVEWALLKPDMQATVAMAAARRFENDSHLSGLLKSLKSLTKLCEGSQDVSYAAREYLIKRATNLEQPGLSEKQAEMVRKAWPDKFKPLSLPDLDFFREVA